MSDKNTTREFWVQQPGRGEIVQGSLEEPGPDDVCVRSLFSAISRGTEALVFRGEVPEERRQEMRAPFQRGDFPGPVKYGYISVGRVEATGASAEALQGRVVFCLHPHQDRYVVPAAAVTVVPEGVPAHRAVLAANMETAINGIWDAHVSVGDSVVIVGGGVVGLLVGWLAARVPGTRVLVVDVNPGRAQAAEALGLSLHGEVPPGIDADVAVHASGSPEGLVAALGAVGVEGRVVEMSWFGTRQVSLPLGGAFHDRRLTIRSSQVGRIPPSRAARWTYRRRLSTALDLLKDEVLDVLISGESPFHELPAVMERLARSGGDTLCHRIRYD